MLQLFFFFHPAMILLELLSFPIYFFLQRMWKFECSVYLLHFVNINFFLKPGNSVYDFPNFSVIASQAIMVVSCKVHCPIWDCF